MAPPIALQLEVLEILNSTRVLTDLDLKWVATMLRRKDLEGLVVLGPLVDLAYQYKSIPDDANEFRRYMSAHQIRATFEHAKNTVFRQKRLLIACPSRRRILPEGMPPANLTGIVVPQTVWHTALPVFGLGHAESRNYYVDFALKDGTFTHILFVDEDQLLPTNIVKQLLAYNLPAIAANYVKKNATLETVATSVLPTGADDIYNQTEIECLPPTHPDAMTPVPVNAVGLGCLLVEVSALAALEKPVFRFTFQDSGAPVVGEDSNFCREMIRAGTPVHVVPGIVSPHCDFQDGKIYGPEWLVDPATRKIRPEFVEKYTKFSVDPKRLFTPHDNPNATGRYVFPEKAPQAIQAAASA